jgi:hypothetical protein
VSNKENNKNYLEKAKKNKLTKIKLATWDLVWIKWEIMLFWDDLVGCALYGKNELVGYIIKSKQFYQSMKSIFMFIWSAL